MSLLTEIVTNLSTSSSSLVDALLQTKVLLHKMGQQDLIEWVNHELNGYPDSMDVPAYRVVHARVLGNIGGYARAEKYPIPVMHLSPERREKLEKITFRQSVAAIQHLMEGDGSITVPIQPEAYALLGKNLAQGIHIDLAWSELNKAEIAEISVQIRSRVLDFILGLQDMLGEDVKDEDIKQRAGQVDTRGLFQNAVFGPNTTIVLGDHNTQRTTNITVKGDFNVLADALRNRGIAEPDIVNLKEAIQQDGPIVPSGPTGFGPKVKAWLQLMLSKAVDASWQIELGVASAFLAEALKKYYGLP